MTYFFLLYLLDIIEYRLNKKNKLKILTKIRKMFIILYDIIKYFNEYLKMIIPNFIL